jgi:hypothetical protein
MRKKEQQKFYAPVLLGDRISAPKVLKGHKIMRFRLGLMILMALALCGQVAALNLAPVGSFAHLAWGGGWKTGILITNNGATDATIVLNSYDDNGVAIAVPWVNAHNGPSNQNGTPVSTLNFTLKAGTVAVLSASSDAPIGLSGWAQVLSDVSAIQGGANFRYNNGGVAGEAFEALEQGTPQVRDAIFDAEPKGNCDNVSEFTSYAIANMTGAQVMITRTITDRVTGQQQFQDQFAIPAYGHKAFLASELVKQPDPAGGPGALWMLRVSSPAPNQITTLGLHFRQFQSCAANGTGPLVFESMPLWPIQ